MKYSAIQLNIAQNVDHLWFWRIRRNESSCNVAIANGILQRAVLKFLQFLALFILSVVQSILKLTEISSKSAL